MMHNVASLTRDEASQLVDAVDLAPMLVAAAARRDAAHGRFVSFSRKVFIPLTRLCRDVCHYCTFAQAPRALDAPYLSPDDVLAIARAGRRAGCREALFTLGDRPETRYGVARAALETLGYASTIDYLTAMAQLVLDETGLLPHVNPGVMTAGEIAALRRVSVSQGLMLESVAERLGAPGGPHHGSPDKDPAARLATLEAAGEARVPFTSGLLIGIGETRSERLEALFALRDLHARHGHLQEVIIQNFRPKPGTRMANVSAASLAELQWTIAAARLVLPAEMNIQAPPNLSPGGLTALIAAGVNDWGGISPVTPDHVNPEAPWPHLDRLGSETGACGKTLIERLALYPAYVRSAGHWLDGRMRPSVLAQVDGAGWPILDPWAPGREVQPPLRDLAALGAPVLVRRSALRKTLDRAEAGARLHEAEIVALFEARDDDFAAVCAVANDCREAVSGNGATYVVTRNINYTNVCGYRCRFCAFSKGKTNAALRGRPYDLPLSEIADRVLEARARGASEVCMQGGIHPDYTGETYLSICRAVKAACPDMHIHAFSPLEIHHGASTLGLPLRDYLLALKEAGLGTLPGTAAEVLDDEVRAILCPDKIDTARWLEIMRTAHAVGFRSTATIMFGHVDAYHNWARHLLHIRDLQTETGGFTEFVPLPFVHMEAPIFLKGQARRGPSFREAVLMHAVARLALNPVLPNIQASWVKMGPDGVRACLRSGANDLGGTLMEESITRAAGASHGSEMTPAALEDFARSVGRRPRQRTTLYGDAGAPSPNLAAGRACVLVGPEATIAC